MLDKYRFYATIAVWASLVLIIASIVTGLAVTGAILTESTLIPIIAGIMFLALMAGFSTARIWRDAAPLPILQVEAAAQKAKRSNRERLERLLESMDEDEVIELETLLMAQERER